MFYFWLNSGFHGEIYVRTSMIGILSVPLKVPVITNKHFTL